MKESLVWKEKERLVEKEKGRIEGKEKGRLVGKEKGRLMGKKIRLCVRNVKGRVEKKRNEGKGGIKRVANRHL